MPTRAEIVNKAREYKDTPFCHQGRIKGQALDCVGLPILVAHELGILDKDGNPITPEMYNDYGPQPHGNLVDEAFRKHLICKHWSKIKPGDVITVFNPSLPCHAAIVSQVGNDLYMIHAYNGGINPRCVEHIMTTNWKRRIKSVFEYPGVTD